MAADDTRTRAAPAWELAVVLCAGLGAMAAFATVGWGGLAIVLACYAVVLAALLAWRWTRRARKPPSGS